MQNKFLFIIDSLLDFIEERLKFLKLTNVEICWKRFSNWFFINFSYRISSAILLSFKTYLSINFRTHLNIWFIILLLYNWCKIFIIITLCIFKKILSCEILYRMNPIWISTINYIINLLMNLYFDIFKSGT